MEEKKPGGGKKAKGRFPIFFKFGRESGSSGVLGP